MSVRNSKSGDKTFFFFQAEDGIRDVAVTGVQTCALPISFTGAVRSKPGKFEMANKGTIFLDEIAEMSTHLQAKLLHVLQDHQYSRLGGRHLVETDVRVLAATNVDVHEAMKTGRFREDLYYRL